MSRFGERLISLASAAWLRPRKLKYITIGLAVALFTAWFEPKAAIRFLQKANNNAAGYVEAFAPGQAIGSYGQLIHSDKVIGGRCVHYRFVAREEERAALEIPWLCGGRMVVFIAPVAAIHAFVLVLWHTLLSAQAVGLLLSLAGTFIGLLALHVLAARLGLIPEAAKEAKVQTETAVKALEPTAENSAGQPFADSVAERARMLGCIALIIAMPVMFFAATAVTKWALLLISAVVGQVLGAILLGLIYWAGAFKLLAIIGATVSHADTAEKLLESEARPDDRSGGVRSPTE